MVRCSICKSDTETVEQFRKHLVTQHEVTAPEWRIQDLENKVGMS